MRDRVCGAACVFLLAFCVVAKAQQAPAASNARILLVPRRMVSGERATLAVLDVNGRLTPGVTIHFSNGDKVTTDETGRALFVAPLTAGPLFASIEGRPGRVATAVLPAREASNGLRVEQAPRIASALDRFEMTGNGFCGDADKNEVTIGGQSALVLASSPDSLVVLPPLDPPTGLAEVSVACGKQAPAQFKIMFVVLKLEADTSPLQPGQKRTLRVKVEGTQEKLQLEARNLAPEIADLAGGNPVKAFSSGQSENAAEFEVTGKKRGRFLISIRLVPVMGKPAR
ncbi:MAG TPA: IPT/TIG domain-containing protein [Candidatus Acidoferrum sp.]|nr:IPT/TIG domain-containing protein [Candidatus Acidoferrum sp.]